MVFLDGNEDNDMNEIIELVDVSEEIKQMHKRIESEVTILMTWPEPISQDDYNNHHIYEDMT